MRVSKHPTEAIKAVESVKSYGALRLSDNETYSSRTTHACCQKAGIVGEISIQPHLIMYITSEKICG